MKNLLFITSLGLAVVFSNAAIGQEVKDGGSAKKETKANSRSNGKHAANRTFGKDRAATVQEMNGETAKIASVKKEDTKPEQKAQKADKKNEKSVSNEAKKHEVKKTDDVTKKADKEAKQAKKEQRKKEKEARKQDKERLKAEKKLMKNSKIK